MRLIKRIQAGRMAKKLQDASAFPDGSLGDVQSQLIGLGPDAIRSVIQSLRSVDARQASIEVLERLVSDSTLPTYLEALASSDPAIVAGISMVLSNAQTYDPTRLLPLFSNPRVSKARLETILSAQMKGIQPRMLISILPDLSRDARGIIFRVLEQRADSSILSDAVKMAVHTEWWLRLHMAKLLARFPSPEGTAAVVRLLDDDNRAVRLEAIQCLGRLKATEAIPGLCGCLRDPDLKIQTAAIDSLIQIHDPAAVPHLVEVLKDESEQARRGAVEVLNEVVTVEAIKDLIHALRDADWWVRVRAADALGSLGGEKVVEAVVSLLKDEDEFVRRYAVEILNTVPSTIAVEPLISALEDPDWWVHERAIDALAKSGDARAVEPLLELMGREPRAIPLTLRALGQLQDARAVETVCRMVSSESPEVRREALLALTSLVRAEMSDELRELATDTLDAAGVVVERKGLRPMEVRRRRGESPHLSAPAEMDPRSNRPPAAAGGTGSPATPTPQPEPKPANFPDLQPGTRLLDRFSVVRRIGGGGFGAVYLVEDVIVREELVLKILNPQLSVDENMIRRFVRELKFTRRITHPNVIRIYDFIDFGTAHGISMEYFPARDLGGILREVNVLPVPRSMAIVTQVCQGLQAAHDQGVIHRDIKPANILVGADDVTKIVDFGLASVGSGGGSRLTKSGILIGTPEYISPEQITGGQVDGRADLYSLGVVMYEMLTGQRPFASENAVNTLFQHLDADVPSMRSLVPEIPEALDKLVMSTISRDPAARPNTALELLTLIRSAV
ncbi:MAG: HEAT repeat domain-containing protein [Candidatus Eisenbacteria bacterium]